MTTAEPTLAEQLKASGLPVNKAQALRLLFSPTPDLPLDAEDLAELPREFHDLPGEMPTTVDELYAAVEDTL